jgi:hypothetical protein
MNKYENSGVYKLKCLTCQGLSIGQTHRNVKTRYKEHIGEIRHNTPKTGTAQHILSTGHGYGNLENIMDIVEQQHKGPYLDTIDKFHIYINKSKGNLILNDNLTELSNPIFEACSK